MSRPFAKRTRNYYAPVAVTSVVNQQTGQKNITLRGREFVTDVVVSFPGTGDGKSSLYAVKSARVSPTDSNLFSWLVPIAEKFEEYKFRALAITFEPQCTTGTTGCVGLYFDPDPTNSPPQTWQTFSNTGCNVHGACWAKHQLVIPPNYYADRRQYYVPDQYADPQAVAAPARSTVQNIPIDPLEYYPGNIGVASVGVIGTGGGYLTIGKLYMDYVITLQKATIDTVPRTAFSGINNTTVVPTGKLVSPYYADNAGSYFMNPLVFSNADGDVATKIALIGVTQAGAAVSGRAAGIPTRYGDEMFNWSVSSAPTSGAGYCQSNVIANQTVDLCYTVMIGGTGMTTGAVTLAWRFENENNAASTLSAYKEQFASNLATSAMFCGTLHIQAGERISLTINPSSGVNASNSFIILAPFPWGLNQ